MAWHVRQQQKRGLSAEFKADVWFAQYQVCAFVNSRPTGDVATVVVDGLDVAAPELADVAAIMEDGLRLACAPGTSTAQKVILGASVATVIGGGVLLVRSARRR